MKLVVATTGPFQIYGAGEEQWVRPQRPCVVRSFTLVDQAVARGRVKVLGQVNDAGTDKELAAMVKQDGADLAVAAFLAMYPVEAAAAPEPAPAPEAPAPQAPKSVAASKTYPRRGKG
jgi:hypothetical protein